jgi:Na+-translocating ferredoxin:NAD+ oxidoreductase subunit E
MIAWKNWMDARAAERAKRQAPPAVPPAAPAEALG